MAYLDIRIHWKKKILQINRKVDLRFKKKTKKEIISLFTTSHDFLCFLLPWSNWVYFYVQMISKSVPGGAAFVTSPHKLKLSTINHVIERGLRPLAAGGYLLITCVTTVINNYRNVSSCEWRAQVARFQPTLRTWGGEWIIDERFTLTDIGPEWPISTMFINCTEIAF